MSLPYWAWCCSDCGKQTTKAYAIKHKGRCKNCVEGVTIKTPGNVRTEEVKTKIGPLGTIVIDKEKDQFSPDVLCTKNFKGYNAHWVANIFKDGLGFSAIVTCIISKNWPVNTTFFCYNLEGVEQLIEWIKDDLKDRETESGIMYHAKNREEVNSVK